jgi:hypothetical protein
MVAEHVLAFGSNTAVIREFRIGWGSLAWGLVLLLPPLSRVALLCALLALLAAVLSRYRS